MMQSEFVSDPSVREWSKLMSSQDRTPDNVDMPAHYTHLPVECIDVTENFGFCLGNAIKYIWRADFKGKPIEDLRKAAWYIEREIARREAG